MSPYLTVVVGFSQRLFQPLHLPQRLHTVLCGSVPPLCDLRVHVGEHVVVDVPVVNGERGKREGRERRECGIDMVETKTTDKE